MQAAFQRTLRSGREYEQYFPTHQLERADPIVMGSGDTYDTIDLMAKLAKQYQRDTAGVAPLLKGKTVRDTCRNDWEFAYRHFQYTPDKNGVEQLRRPLRAWADRRAGIDCDCFSILVSTLLLNQGIAHKLRKTKYDGKADFQHIYVIVPTGGGSHITIDPVTDAFDKEVPFSAKFDKDMPLPIQVLNGPADAPAAPAAPPRVAQGDYSRFGFSAEFVGLEEEAEQVRQQTLQTVALSGLAAAATSNTQASQQEVTELARVTGQTHEEATADAAAVEHLATSFAERCRQMLVNTAERIDALPQKNDNLLRLRGRTDLLLNAWSDEDRRDELFAQLGALEAQETMGMAGLGNWFSDAWDWTKNAVSSTASGISQAASWVKNNAGNLVSTVGGAIKQASSWVADKVKQGANAVAEGVKNAAKWVGKEALELGKLLVKYNPLSILIRGGLRIAFNVNLFHMAGRLGHGYFSEAQARARGFDVSEWRKGKDQLDKVKAMWSGLQGDEGILRDSIMAGYQGGEQPKLGPTSAALSGLACLPAAYDRPGADTSGLGEPVTAATTAAASGFIATIITWLKNVDWGKLFGAAVTLAEKLKLKKTYDSVPAVTATTPLPSSVQDYQANAAKYEAGTPASGTSSSALPIALGLGAVVAILLTHKAK